MVLRRKRVKLTKGSPEVQSLAQKRANQRMRQEVLPLLSRRHPRPNSWNPLRAAKGPSAYGMKLWLPDALALEILNDDDLMALTEQIVLEETTDAALTEPQAFVTSILEQLMDES